MYKRNVIVLLIVVAILGFAVSALALPLFGRQNMQLGLDLKGGVHLVYELQLPDDATAKDKADAMERTVDTIRTRIDKFGVTDPVIQSQENGRILIQLPGYSNIDEAKKLVEQTGFLEFREIELNSDGNPAYLSDYLKATDFVNKSIPGIRIFANEEGAPVAILEKDAAGTFKYFDVNGNPLSVDKLNEGDTRILSWVPARGDDGTVLTGGLLSEATPQINTGTIGAQAEVSIVWNKEGTVIFDQIARRLYGHPYPTGALGIFLDNTLLSAPVIQQPSYGGSGVITGGFTTDEATHLANLLSSGSLPMPLEKPPLYEEVVSATLGANFVDMSVKAGIIALLLIMVFMIAYYKIPGLMASLALLFYGSVILAIFKIWPVTLNLAAIGGFVLSLGMAVDANVLIFERMKEEIRNGRSLRVAIDAGFKRAWLAIRDSNVTTIIACIILFWVGGAIIAGEAVRGFAITLGIGVLVSMFTAVTVTRALLNIFIGTKIAKRTSLFSAWSGRN